MVQYVVIDTDGNYVRTKGVAQAKAIKSNGKGKGREDEGTLHGKHHPLNDKFKSYYFDMHPHNANGRRASKYI